MNQTRGPKIYLLPNLMTAGNLFCGFAAVLRIYDGAQRIDLLEAASDFHDAIWFILAACIFDLLDGRLARLGGNESDFGREFDSLADIVSFGMAPALLVYQIVLGEFQNLGWMIAFVYLACGALRLARFNCVSASGSPTGSRCVNTVTGGSARRISASMRSSSSWPRCTDQSGGTSTCTDTNRRAPAWRVLSA